MTGFFPPGGPLDPSESEGCWLERNIGKRPDRIFPPWGGPGAPRCARAPACAQALDVFKLLDVDGSNELEIDEFVVALFFFPCFLCF